MGFDEFDHKQNFHRRVDGSGVPPMIRHVVGTGSEYQQGWKTGNGPNWPMGELRKAPETHALDEAFFRRSKG